MILTFHVQSTVPSTTLFRLILQVRSAASLPPLSVVGNYLSSSAPSPVPLFLPHASHAAATLPLAFLPVFFWSNSRLDGQRGLSAIRAFTCVFPSLVLLLVLRHRAFCSSSGPVLLGGGFSARGLSTRGLDPYFFFSLSLVFSRWLPPFDAELADEGYDP